MNKRYNHFSKFLLLSLVGVAPAFSQSLRCFDESELTNSPRFDYYASFINFGSFFTLDMANRSSTSGSCTDSTSTQLTLGPLTYLIESQKVEVTFYNVFYQNRVGPPDKCSNRSGTDTWKFAADRVLPGSAGVFCVAAVQQNKTLSLVSSTPSANEIRPVGTGGNSVIDLVARVVEGAIPKAGVAVAFTIEVVPKSGGHEHHDPVRPKGTLSKFSGTTDANGEVKLSFTATELAGIHTVKASCANCTNSPVSKEITVKVPDLIAISPESPRNADGTLVYALTSVELTNAGNVPYHLNQYYLTKQALINLTQLISGFASAGWGTVALNDASLLWGGVYDIKGNWGAPHKGHRDGREIDISFTRARNPVSRAKQNEVYKKFCESNGVNVPFSILHHFVLLPHFHVYLEKQKACNRTEG